MKTVMVKVTSADIKAKVVELIQSLSTIVNVQIENGVTDKTIEPGDFFHEHRLNGEVTIVIKGKR